MAGFWQSAWERIGGTRPAYDPPESDRPPGVQALQLLVRNLSPAQRQQFARHDYFDVIGSDTGRRYRIRVGRTLNVAQLNASGGCVRLLCFEPQGQLPVGDVMLAQKIALELFESETIRVANKSPTWELGRELLWPDHCIDRHDHLRFVMGGCLHGLVRRKPPSNSSISLGHRFPKFPHAYQA